MNLCSFKPLALIFVGIWIIVFGVCNHLNATTPTTQSAALSLTHLVATDFYITLSPLSEHKSVDKNIVNKLNKQHLRSQKMNDDLSIKMYDRYLSDLDPTRSYFLASDIKEFDYYRDKLDDAIQKADLKPAFLIFNRYLKRVIERQVFSINFIGTRIKHMTFTENEWFETDRKKSPWPLNIKELDEIWRKRLKQEVLSLKLADKEIDNIIELLDKRYRNQLNRTTQSKSEDAFRTYMNALTQSYDPHTQYFSPRVSENFNIQMSLSLEGIGAVLQIENEYTKVLRLVPAGPADKAGDLKPGDYIVGVGQGKDGEIVDVIGWRLDDVVQLIRGPKGTIVRLTIIPVSGRDEQTRKTIQITRDTVKLEEQAAKKQILEVPRDNHVYKIGVIDIPTFYLDFKGMQSGSDEFKSTTRDVRRLIEELNHEQVVGLIIDLRENGGGALQEANSLTGLFIKRGPIVQVKGTNGRTSLYYDHNPELIYQGPLTVIVNRMSASASEIFAGAIQDYERGLIVGSQTFGKGTVQTLLDLERGQLKLTHAQFYRISGKSTQYNGIIPDIAYPSIYDIDIIGENTLPEALPFDKIDPAPYESLAMYASYLDKMTVSHNKRIAYNPEFDYLSASFKRRKELREKTKISLNEEKRKAEIEESKQWELGWENKKRIAKGLPKIASLDELSKDKKKNDEANKSSDISDDEEDTDSMDVIDLSDPILIETGQILLDYFILNQGSVAKSSGR